MDWIFVHFVYFVSLSGVYIRSMKYYVWKRYGGYEVSTKGDKRFSAFNAIMLDGRSLECHYQCDVKGYSPGGKNWRLGKGKPSLIEYDSLFDQYLNLWLLWFNNNHDLLLDLHEKAKDIRILSDRFATTEVNQAHALSIILNSMINSGQIK